MDVRKINWKEAFLFFYWDVKKYRPKDMQRVNEIILSFFEDEEPGVNTGCPPRPWNDLLRCLMKSLRCHMGSNIMPGNYNIYSWLTAEDFGEAMAANPFVDWVRLRSHFAGDLSLAVEVLSILKHIETVAYGPLESLPVWKTTTEAAWSGNPFLVDFQKAHGLQPWGVPLSLSTINTLAQLSYIKRYISTISIQQSANGSAVENDNTSKIDLSVRFDNHEATTLVFKSQGAGIELKTLNLFKRLYVALLLWSHESRAANESTDIHQLMERHFSELGPDDDTMGVNKQLWGAVRTVGLDPF